MKLAHREEGLLGGEEGLDLKKAEEIIAAYREACEAEKIIPITSAHMAEIIPL